MNWYQLSGEETLQRLATTAGGLTEEEAAERLARHGPNELAAEEKISRLAILLHQFASPLIYILLIAAVVTAALSEYIDTGVILAAVLLNAAIGYVQEYKAEESVRALKRMVVPRARVLRGGAEHDIDSKLLVPGDIVLLSSGVRVPADLRLLKTIELRVEEAMLTGESVPAEKDTRPLGEADLAPGDQRNMAFMGTVVVGGRAKGVVAETGGRTLLGSIAQEVREAGVTRAPLQEKFHHFARMIGYIVLAAAALLILIGVLIGEPLKDMFMTAVAAAVAAIPEGLPVVATIAMTIGVSRMARRQAIVRKLPAVETLGSTTVICTDKTGTLTRNEMTVKLIRAGEHVFEVGGSGYAPRGAILREGAPVEAAEHEDLLLCLRIGLLCNESDVYEEAGEYKVDGDPTEGALITAAMKAGLRPEEERDRFPQLAIVPFESERGYMATLHSYAGRRLIFVKGGPERVLEMCQAQALALERQKTRETEVLETAASFARQGMRVLAMAWKEAAASQDELSHHDAESGLTFAGLQAMMDPPRPEAVEAIAGCHQAGVRVVMITGDHAVTALSIGKMIGIASADSEVLTGQDLERMSDEELFARVAEVPIFARVSPHHKSRITQQLLRHGEIVAVTGDGVNDAPALKAAHIGVAMGRTGTDVAKEASDMVIVDDNFASIFSAVEEGRIVFDNIRKVTFFLIPTGLAAILSITATILLGVPLPFLPAQLLWINIVTNGLQDVALAFEPGEPGIIRRPPRDPQEGIMSRLLIERSVVVAAVISAGVIFEFLEALERGVDIERARTIAMTTMVFFQFFQAWNSRSEEESIFSLSPVSNPFLFYSMVAALFAQLAVIYVPALQWVFRTQPLSGAEWVRIAAVSVTVVFAVEIDKWLRRGASS